MRTSSKPFALHHQEAVAGVLSAQEKAGLILDLASAPSVNVTLIKELLTDLSQSGDETQLSQFLLALKQGNNQVKARNNFW